MTLELINELGDIHSRQVKDRPLIERMKPLRTGDYAPVIGIARTDDHWQTASLSTPGPVSNVLTLNQLVVYRPIVVGFYCPCWGRYAAPFLDTLIQLAHRVERAGGQLVVFTNEPPKYLPQKARQAPLVLVYDADKSVARQFGVYSEADPIWDRISGISEEVYSPALYLIDGARRIQYHFLDENFEGFADHAALDNALFQ